MNLFLFFNCLMHVFRNLTPSSTFRSALFFTRSYKRSISPFNNVDTVGVIHTLAVCYESLRGMCEYYVSTAYICANNACHLLSRVNPRDRCNSTGLSSCLHPRSHIRLMASKVDIQRQIEALQAKLAECPQTPPAKRRRSEQGSVLAPATPSPSTYVLPFPR